MVLSNVKEKKGCSTCLVSLSMLISPLAIHYKIDLFHGIDMRLNRSSGCKWCGSQEPYDSPTFNAHVLIGTRVMMDVFPALPGTGMGQVCHTIRSL